MTTDRAFLRGMRRSVEQSELGLEHLDALRRFGLGQSFAERLGLVRLLGQGLQVGALRPVIGSSPDTHASGSFSRLDPGDGSTLGFGCVVFRVIGHLAFLKRSLR